MTAPDPSAGMARRSAYLQIVGDVHREWAESLEPNRFAPEEHPPHSDYNVETIEYEATTEQLNQRDAMILERATAAGLEDFHPKRYGP